MTKSPRRAARTSKPAPKTVLRKAEPNAPVLHVAGPRRIVIRQANFRGRALAHGTAVSLPKALEPGADYIVLVGHKSIAVERLAAAALPDDCLGGFHFAPGGNAKARAGGDAVPAINPCSAWDVNFRPECADVRGMALITAPTVKPFWCDIYLTAVEHYTRDCTSLFGATIADGADRPQRHDGNGLFDKFDYAAAIAVFKHHGKGVLSFEEFGCAAYGVTEKTAAGTDPKITGLDAARTSKFGLMQATGNMWVWGHDGDPDGPRASVFGGAWGDGASAGSRCASVGYWPGFSAGNLGARGRCDHLQLG